MNLKSITLLTVIVLMLGVASYSFPISFALTSGAPVKPHLQGTTGVQRQTIPSGGGEQGPSPAGGGNGFGTTGVQRQTIPSGGGEQGPSAVGGGTGFGTKTVTQNQQGNQGTMGTQVQKCIGPIISVSTPSTSKNYIRVDNMGPWINLVSNLHVTAGSHKITIDRYSYQTGNLIQHITQFGYTDNCHSYTFKMS